MKSQTSENSNSRLLLLIALVAMLLPVAVWSSVSGQRRRPVAAQVRATNQGEGMQFRLSEGTEANDRQQSLAAPPAAPLSDEATNNLLKRLPPIKTDADDQKDFALRDRSLPPPKTGQTISGTFPPPDNATPPETTASGPLEILRFAPEGEIAIAPHLTVTFSQPMVAVTSQTDAAQNVPVKLTPQPPGKWRWLGTKTLIFEPEGRFPMATNYTAEIPAGTKSATGNALGAAKRWTFATPPVQMKSSYPNDGPHGRNPVFFIEFDQRIDQAAMLKSIRLTGNGNTWKLRLATSQEIETDDNAHRRAKSAEKGRWLAFVAEPPIGAPPDQPLPAGTTFTVQILAGAPSAEGPRTTAAAQKFTFRTYDALKLTAARCGYGDGCRPFTPFNLEFNNPLDAKAFQPSQVKVTPAIEGMKVSVYYSGINITGATKGRTTYTVTVDGSLRDTFGQTLGSNEQRTFNVGSAYPFLSASGNGFVVLDPNGPPRFSIFSVNQPSVKVRLYAVGPEHWTNYFRYLNHDRRQPIAPPGRLVKSDTVNINGQPDEITETAIDVSPALKNGFGHAVLIVEPTVKRNEYEQGITLWLQATQIGLDAFADYSDLVGWATSLKDGKPASGVEMSLAVAAASGQEASATTGNDGVARFALPANPGQKLLIARKGEDVAILPESPYWWEGNQSQWQKRSVNDWLTWHVLDDRAMYRPGEEVHVKGWLRRIGGGKSGDVGLATELVKSVSYVLYDSRGNEVTKGSLRVNALGGFDTKFKLPPTMNLGHANMTFFADGVPNNFAGFQVNHAFQVQEFRRPEYEVKVAAANGPHFIRGFATVTAAASYYAGGALPNADAQWQVTATPTNYTPPNRGDFIFGTWTPWWWGDQASGQGVTQNFAGHTDAAGKHTVRIDFDSVSPIRATNINAQATVQDVNRQAISGSTSFIVHPSELYVGIRSPRTFVQKGEPLVVEAIATDIDGKLIAGREIRMRAVLIDWNFENGEWKERETNPQECVVKSGNAAVQCSFRTNDGGRYRVTASIIDDRERRNESQMTLWVAGGKTEPQRDLAQEKVELIPNQKEYESGQTAEILVQAPFFPAEGVVTLRRSGLVSTERFTMTTASHTLKIPINEAYVPNLHVQVDLVGAASRTDDAGNVKNNLPKRPAFASGALNLSVPPLKRKLTVAATPRDKALEPGGETTVDVELRDAAGKPVAGGEVAVIVVDEAVLALSNYQLADPLNTFYNQRGADVSDYHLRRNVVLAKPDALIGQAQQGQQEQQVNVAFYSAPTGDLGTRARQALAKAAPMAEMAMRVDDREQQVAQPIRTRIDFNALATFAPALPTDANGRASVKVKVPDNLTRYRVMAVAVAGEKQFGTGESAITARLPLMVRPSAPRFLNFGDKFELPVVVQNQTDNPMEVDVALRAANMQLIAGAGRRVTVPANDRVEVRFPTTTLKPGTARFQIAAASGRWADSAEVSLPVWTPATTEAFATYGEVDAGAILQPVKAPSDAFKQFGGLEITTSSTQLQALTDAVIYLTNYPYDCAEQISSRVLAVAALKDVLGAFDAKGLPSADELLASMSRDMERLKGLQNGDGGFGFWRRNEESWPYVSIHVAHAMQRAKEKGFDVPAEMMQRSQTYLRQIESKYPAYYGPEIRRTLTAYALYVRNRMNDRDAAKARTLIAEAGGVEKVPLEALGWLLPVLSGDSASQTQLVAIRRHLANRAEETAGTAHFTTSYSDGAHLLLHSNRRADGIILESLIGDDPNNDLIPKIVRGLLAHRVKGRWENTQENAFVLLALDRYFQVYEKATPNFVARAWLGDAFAGGYEYRGRTTDSHQINIPMSYLMAQPGQQNLALSKEGTGRLYYRIGMNYAPTSLQLKPYDAGFTVSRTYEAVDDPNDVRRLEDGSWRIKAGARVRVRLTMFAQSRRYHVALVDPMPAGFEALNPELAVTGGIPRDDKDTNARSRWGWWSWQWFEHQNMRDERVEAFTALLWEGVYNYSYVARATTPGNFVVPPAKAEEMYHPETFGRGASDRVVVE
ncbi:MAG TPA: alpha-2-macroglobulin family protein [Blastocatellia bacterium]|nr:alpha-2-macroglobulin family protein [Blastocatellia bacterium]HNG33344.1 alpha-2-macroglobulin family protein [Blastocatellia bacterium]